MLLGELNSLDTYFHYLQRNPWAEALDWIRRHATNAEQGIYFLRESDMFVNVHGYATIEAEEARFESHFRYIDLQYCIRGGETILWRPCSISAEDPHYDADNDVRLRSVSGSYSSLTLLPGMFVIFFPQDEHAPKITNGVDPDIWKLVVKIDRALL